ncbi:CoA transferase [Sphingobium arseniciresistens]|uniref:CaiB/BaiF CoA transferase family protein n=1 Tax=Sphingobium arseniciresistens TaxID=3030834 RepID=UPI0030CA541C
MENTAKDNYTDTMPIDPKMERPLPLSGVRVLDLGHVFQGPYATFLMAMAGADVIKVEPPTGDVTRKRARDGDYPFRALNGSKRGIVLNLKTSQGKALLKELCKSADVLVENFAPGVMARLGVGPDDLLKINPRLIYASASGFGATGPYANKRALDLTIQAMSGFMSTTGEAGGRPLKAGAPVADFMSGAHLYGAIVSALFERERTGLGRAIELSMLESVFAPMLPSIGHVYSSNSVPERTGNRHVADSYVPFDTFETSDGWVAIVCANDDHWLKLTQAMNRPDLTADETLRTLSGRVAHIEEITAAVSAWTKTQTREQICDLCDKNQVAAAPLRDVMELLNDVHLRERGFLTDRMTEAGMVALPNSPMRYMGSPLRELSDPPELGEHTEQVLVELLKLKAEELAEIKAAGAIG